MDNLERLLDEVKDRGSFLVFVRALVAERQEARRIEAKSPSRPYGPDAMGWENTTIEDYLEAAVACTEAWIEREHEIPDEPSWNSFARFLYFGKSYE